MLSSDHIDDLLDHAARSAPAVREVLYREAEIQFAALAARAGDSARVAELRRRFAVARGAEVAPPSWKQLAQHLSDPDWAASPLGD